VDADGVSDFRVSAEEALDAPPAGRNEVPDGYVEYSLAVRFSQIATLHRTHLRGLLPPTTAPFPPRWSLADWFHTDDEKTAFRTRAFQAYFDQLTTIKLPPHPGSSLAHLAHFLRLHDPPNPRYIDPATAKVNPNGRALSLKPGSLLTTGHLLVLMER